MAYFVETSERQGTPLIYLQDVSGFMVGPEAEREGIIRAGAEMVETMSCATVPKIVLTLNHASGAGYYAMAGQGFDPNFTFSWPTARIGVMEGDSAVVALFAAELEKYKGEPLPEELQQAIEKTRADYERWLDARYAAARGHCDAMIDPLDTRQGADVALEVAAAKGHRGRLGPGALGKAVCSRAAERNDRHPVHPYDSPTSLCAVNGQPLRLVTARLRRSSKFRVLRPRRSKGCGQCGRFSHRRHRPAAPGAQRGR